MAHSLRWPSSAPTAIKPAIPESQLPVAATCFSSGVDPTISISAYLPIRPSLPGVPAAAPPLGRYKPLSTP